MGSLIVGFLLPVADEHVLANISPIAKIPNPRREKSQLKKAIIFACLLTTCHVQSDTDQPIFGQTRPTLHPKPKTKTIKLWQNALLVKRFPTARNVNIRIPVFSYLLLEAGRALLPKPPEQKQSIFVEKYAPTLFLTSL